MKIKFRNCLIIILLLLVVISCGLAFKFMSKSAGAQTVEDTEEFEGFCANAVEMADKGRIVEYDALVGCLGISDTKKHGNGRMNGGANLVNEGCRNYLQLKDNDGKVFTYGTTDIPYWINMNEMNKITNVDHRQQMIDTIRVQTELWNQVYMHDGTGKLVNFYEVASESKPDYDDGKRVIEVTPYDFGSKSSKKGQFALSVYTIRLGYNFTSREYVLEEQTVAHEFGHVLGLGDLDGEKSSVHSVLMGYGLSINSETLTYIMDYPTIQGVANLNHLHTCSDANFMRYMTDSRNNYHHICFYCDRVLSDSEAIQGSKKLMEVCDANSHDYRPIVSSGDVRWDKCTKCYKVKRNELFADNFNMGSGSSEKISFITGFRESFTVEANSGEKLPKLDKFAPTKPGYIFDGYCDASGKRYYNIDHVEDTKATTFSVSYYASAEIAVPINDTQIWDHGFPAPLYAIFKPLECYYSYKIKCGDSVIGSGETYLRNGINSITPKEIDGYKFKYFHYYGKEFSSVPAEIKVTLHCNHKIRKDENEKGEVISTSVEAVIEPEYDIIYAVYEKVSSGKDPCLATGSLITLADGSQVAVENLTGNEMLLVWNLFTGTYDSAPILFIDKDPAQVYEVINLLFSDGSTVRIIYEHGFWDYDLNKYVYLDADAAKYIGHWFNKGDGRVQLVGVEIKDEYTSAWSPVTYGHLCYYVDGMLSMPGGIDGLFNIFDVDADTMKYDEVSMSADIEQYGLFTYEEFIEYFYLPEEAFEAFNGQYLKVAIGKGLITMEELASLYERYSEFLA